MKMKFITTILTVLTIFTANAQLATEFYSVEILSNTINSDGEEAKTLLNDEGTIMYFGRAYHKENQGYTKSPENVDIWTSVKDENGDWKMATNEASINDEKNNSIIGIGKNNHFFLLNTYQDKKNLQFGIAVTNKEAEHKWSTPKVIEIPNLKYKGKFYDFYITHDEKALLISIKGDDSKGEEDLYVSLNKDGKWSSPINLGEKINTSGFEMSPYLTSDNKFLYFSTNGRSDGFGDADIYVSERLDDTWTNWSEPKNLGNVVNSSKMDCYFTATTSGQYFFSSNREGSQGLDIYEAKLAPPTATVTGKLLSAKDSTAINGEIKLVGSDEKNLLTDSENTNSFSVEVLTKATYQLNATAQGFDANSLAIDLTNTESGATVMQNLYLTPNEEVVAVVQKEKVEVIEKPIVLKRVLHPYDEVGRSSETKINIDDVIQTMKDYPFMVIQIESYTDSKGTEEYNLDLSKRRASSAKTYLIRNGISGARIKVKWFGETLAVAPNTKKDGSDYPEGRAKNRRTEFKIVSNEKK